MSLDSRLADMTVLVLAAKRRLGTRQAPDWRRSEGMASLLAAAGALPRRDPWALPDLEGGGSMGLLLAEARRWEEERRGA